MKPIRIILLIVAIIAGISQISAQSPYTPEEIAFFKSLNGKWNRASDYSAKWGTWCYDITLRYVNGKFKVSYSDVIIANKERSILATKITDAFYDPADQCLNISYTHHILDTDEIEDKYRNMYVPVSISIPFQPDIDDTILVYSHDKYPTGIQETNEVFYYKH